jgi:hypothetical protein
MPDIPVAILWPALGLWAVLFAWLAADVINSVQR